MKRQGWDRYFMDIAHKVSSRATCDRLRAGAVIVKDKMILSTGYNGSVRGLPHCDDIGHEMVDDHCIRTVHAEINAIAQAARAGTAIEGATIYVTANPCYRCFKPIVNAGIKKIVYDGIYRELNYSDLAGNAGVQIKNLSNRG